MGLMYIFITGLFIVWVLSIILLTILLFKNENTYKNDMIIINAINDYNLNCIDRGCYTEVIDYALMKDYNTIMWRLFDWGYENILPKEEFEKIKPFIKE